MLHFTFKFDMGNSHIDIIIVIFWFNKLSLVVVSPCWVEWIFIIKKSNSNKKVLWIWRPITSFIKSEFTKTVWCSVNLIWPIFLGTIIKYHKGATTLMIIWFSSWRGRLVTRGAPEQARIRHINRHCLMENIDHSWEEIVVCKIGIFSNLNCYLITMTKNSNSNWVCRCRWRGQQ